MIENILKNITDTITELWKRVKELERIQLPVLWGSSFPTSPSTGQSFFRTDLGFWCYYDGTRWLTQNVSNSGSPLLSAAATDANFWVAELREDYAPYIVRVSCTTRVATTNNGSNFYTITLEGQNQTFSGATTISSFTTASDTVNVYTKHDTAPTGTANPSNKSHFNVNLVKTLSPGTILFVITVYYRLIVT